MLNRKSLQLQKLLFSHRQLSRQKLIQLSGFDPRTVSRHLAELVRQDLAFTLPGTESVAKKQSLVYELRRENVRFGIFSLNGSELFFIRCDLQGTPRHYAAVSLESAAMPMAELQSALLQKCRGIIAQQPPLCAIAIALLPPHFLHKRFCSKIAAALETQTGTPVCCGNGFEFLLAKYVADENISGSCAAICCAGNGAVSVFSAADGFADDTVALWQKALNFPPRTLRLSRSRTLAEVLDFTRFINGEFPAAAAAARKEGDPLQYFAGRAAADPTAAEVINLYALLLAECLTLLHNLGGAETFLLLQMPYILAETVRSHLAPEIAAMVRQRQFNVTDTIAAPCSFFTGK